MTTTQDIRNINTLFAPLGLKVDNVIECAQSIKYILNLPLDLAAQAKIKRAESSLNYAISSAIGTKEFIYGHDNSSVYIEKRSNNFKVVKFEENVQYLPDNGLLLLLGADEFGQRQYIDLRKAPHILVAGTTGSGKSELLHTFIASLIYRRDDNPVYIVIVDPKRSEFSIYEDKDGIRLVTETSEAIGRLKDCCTIMEERYKKIQANHCKDIYELNDPSIHPIVVVVDELKDLLMQEKDAEYYIVRLAQKARACGIHLILGTQSPRADTITGLIKANIPTKIALHTSNSIESRIILDQNGAEKLFGNGDMLYLGNGALSVKRIQSAYLSSDIKQRMANCLMFVKHAPYKTPEQIRSERADEWQKQYDMNHARTLPTPPPATPKTKRLGLFGMIHNLMKVKPIMFRTDDYPPKI